MRKTLTLIELIIALSLLMMVILGATSFDLASVEFLKSSERKTAVVNEANFILDHIQKNVAKAVGYVEKSGISMASNVLTIRVDNNNTPSDFADDTSVTYTYDPIQHTLVFSDGTTLSKRVCAFDMDTASWRIEVKDFELRYDPNATATLRDNPAVKLANIFLGSRSHSTH
jgi:Tfp pilus assembly protein PilW